MSWIAVDFRALRRDGPYPNPTDPVHRNSDTGCCPHQEVDGTVSGGGIFEPGE